MPIARDVVIATAGHINHGKSALVAALTGTHPDRLAEERRRGLTIELGFAALARPDGGMTSLIDVPGHERFIDTMIAGVTGIDAALLVVAADDGPMPQTHEHLRIIALLGISQLFVAITKTDLVENDWLDLIDEAVRSAVAQHGLQVQEFIHTSARTGAGIDALRTSLATARPNRRVAWSGQAWLPIDRVFSIRGAGTVVTGTLVSGHLTTGSRVHIGNTGVVAPIRQLESHGTAVHAASPGQRLAVNLTGVRVEQVRRGDVLSELPITMTRHADVAIVDGASALRVLPSGTRIMVHSGIRADAAAVRWLGPRQSDTLSGRTALVQLRFDSPVPILSGHRLILRRQSPPETIAGGMVLDTDPARPGSGGSERMAELTALASGDPAPRLAARLRTGPVAYEDAVRDLPGDPAATIDKGVEQETIVVLDATTEPALTIGPGSHLISTTCWLTYVGRLDSSLSEHHQRDPAAFGPPIAPLARHLGIPRAHFELLLAHAMFDGIVVRRATQIGLRTHRRHIPPSEQTHVDEILTRSEQPHRVDACDSSAIAADTLDLLIERHLLVRSGPVICGGRWFDRAMRLVVDRIGEAGPRPLARLRDDLGISRDVAEAIFEHADDLGITRRVADGRIAGARAEAWLSRQAERDAIREGHGILTRADAVRLRHEDLARTGGGPSVFLGRSIAELMRSVGTTIGKLRAAGETVRLATIAEWQANSALRSRIGVTNSGRYVIPLSIGDDPGVVDIVTGISRDDGSAAMTVLWYEDLPAVTDERLQLHCLGQLSRMGRYPHPYSSVPVADSVNWQRGLAEGLSQTELDEISAQLGVRAAPLAVANALSGYHRAIGWDGAIELLWQAPTSSRP